MNYQNYALGKWITGEGEGAPLYNAITGAEIGSGIGCLIGGGAYKTGSFAMTKSTARLFSIW
mgnify:CR=1 FL=1